MFFKVLSKISLILKKCELGAIIEYPFTFETIFKGSNTNKDALKSPLNIMSKVYKFVFFKRKLKMTN